MVLNFFSQIMIKENNIDERILVTLYYVIYSGVHYLVGRKT